MKSLKDTFLTPEIDKLITAIMVISGCEVKRSDSTITIKRGKVDMLSAITPDGKKWSVQAHEKLFPANCYWSNKL